MNQSDKTLPQDQIDIKKITLALLEKKLLIVSVTSFFAILSVVIALMIPNVYTSNSFLSPTVGNDSLSSKLGQFSSLASLGGIDLPGGTATKSDEAIARIQSFDFFAKYFLPNVKLENILGVKKWDASNNQIIYKKNLYDVENKEWVRKKSPTIPSEQEAFKRYKKLLSIGVNKENGFVSISMKHNSPFIAKRWLDIIIYNINESIRLEDISLSEAYIDFLNQSQKSVNLKSLKETTSNLLLDQMQTLMLASSNKDYVFKVIDAPIAPEKKSGPNRPIICVLITLLGLIVSLSIVFIQNFKKALKE
jgi:hypothetical protein